jgi:glucose dehydrogenase
MRMRLKVGLTAFLAGGVACSLAYGAPPGDRGWPYFGNDSGAGRYSTLKQIHRGNVRELQVAWV